ncbi:unnamed protein product, partial [Allacma fusca]
MKQRLLIIFSYIGTNYCGMQTQRANINVKSIQKVLEKTFETVVKHPVNLVLSSRTDKGVHALESTAQVDIPEG